MEDLNKIEKIARENEMEVITFAREDLTKDNVIHLLGYKAPFLIGKTKYLSLKINKDLISRSYFNTYEEYEQAIKEHNRKLRRGKHKEIFPKNDK